MHLHSADIPQAFLPPDLPVKLVCGKESVGMPDEEGQVRYSMSARWMLRPSFSTQWLLGSSVKAAQW